MPELLAMVPSARYIQTTREPKVWAKSRISQHRHLLNLPHCKPEWVNVTSSYFNVFECVAAAGDAITRSGADEEVHCSRQIIYGPGTRIRELLVDLRPSTGLRGRLPVAGQASADLRLGRWFCGSRWCQGEWRPELPIHAVDGQPKERKSHICVRLQGVAAVYCEGKPIRKTPEHAHNVGAVISAWGPGRLMPDGDINRSSKKSKRGPLQCGMAALE